MQNYSSNGKLLLTGEYVVLDGALSLAVPTKFGQSLHVEPNDAPEIIWKSLDEKETLWFEGTFLIKDITSSLNDCNDDSISKRLIEILNAAKQLNPNFINSNHGYKVTTALTFPRDWGLGTSSTLINNIAKWANINAYELLNKTFGGSGYDIACAQHNTPITYVLQGNKPHVEQVLFNPTFKTHLYFVYLNKKQNSRAGIKQYNTNKVNSHTAITEINTLTSQLITCKTLIDFESLITAHEQIISKITKQKPVKDLLFRDFNGSIKSLGAWGGDFILVASKENPIDYFESKGFTTIIPYKDMVL